MQTNNFFKTLRFIHIALCLGLLTFAGLAYYETQAFNISTDTTDSFIYIVPIVAITAYFASKWLFNKSIKSVKSDGSLMYKMQGYLKSNIIQFAIIEGAGFLALFAYFNSGNALYFVIGLCLILYLYSLKPSFDKFKNEIPISFEEQKEFNTLQK